MVPACGFGKLYLKPQEKSHDGYVVGAWLQLLINVQIIYSQGCEHFCEILVSFLLKPLQLAGSVAYIDKYSHHMTSYLEAVGAVFEAYNRLYQLTRVLYESQFSSLVINLLFKAT